MLRHYGITTWCSRVVHTVISDIFDNRKFNLISFKARLIVLTERKRSRYDAIGHSHWEQNVCKLGEREL